MEAAASPPSAPEHDGLPQGNVDVGITSDTEEDAELGDIVRMYDVEERQKARQYQREVLSTIETLGGDRRAVRRERARQTRAIQGEL